MGFGIEHETYALRPGRVGDLNLYFQGLNMSLPISSAQIVSAQLYLLSLIHRIICLLILLLRVSSLDYLIGLLPCNVLNTWPSFLRLFLIWFLSNGSLVDHRV